MPARLGFNEAVGLTDRNRRPASIRTQASKSPRGENRRFRGENRRDSWLSSGENRLNY
jgi:hypothetical protein